MAAISSGTLDNGYDSDCGGCYEPDLDLQIYCSRSFHEYCGETRCRPPKVSKEEPKASKEEPRARCHAGDLAGCSSSKLTELIKKVSFQGKTYALTIEEVGDDEESVPDCSQLKPPRQWVVGGLNLALKEGSIFKDIRVEQPCLEDLMDVISGRKEFKLKRPVKRQLVCVTSDEKRVKLETTTEIKCTTTAESVKIDASCSVLASASSSKPLCAPVVPPADPPVVPPVPSVPPVPPVPPVDPSQSPPGGREDLHATKLGAHLERLLEHFKEPDAIQLNNNVGKKLIYEIMTYLFSMDPMKQRPHIIFTTGQDTNQRGGWKGVMRFQRSPVQTTLTPTLETKKPTTVVTECPFSGVPDVVGITPDWEKIRFIVEVKSDNESRSEGIGQLLITAIVTCMKSQCKVLALLLHPKSISLYEVYTEGEDECKIKRIFHRSGPKVPHDRYLTKTNLLDALIIILNFF